MKELTALEQKLEAVYTAAHKKSAATEEDNKDTVAYEGLTKQMEDSQRAFESYIEAECAYEAGVMGAGTFSTDAKIRCRIELLSERIRQLKRSYSGI